MKESVQYNIFIMNKLYALVIEWVNGKLIKESWLPLYWFLLLKSASCFAEVHRATVMSTLMVLVLNMQSTVCIMQPIKLFDNT